MQRFNSRISLFLTASFKVPICNRRKEFQLNLQQLKKKKKKLHKIQSSRKQNLSKWPNSDHFDVRRSEVCRNSRILEADFSVYTISFWVFSAESYVSYSFFVRIHPEPVSRKKLRFIADWMCAIESKKAHALAKLLNIDITNDQLRFFWKYFCFYWIKFVFFLLFW